MEDILKLMGFAYCRDGSWALKLPNGNNAWAEVEKREQDNHETHEIVTIHICAGSGESLNGITLTVGEYDD